MNTTATICQVCKPGHPWNGRFVITTQEASYSWGSIETELPEEQSMPSPKRMVCAFRPEDLRELPQLEQEQVAGTFGLNLERLPYKIV